MFRTNDLKVPTFSWPSVGQNIVWGDISRITRNYYLSCNPARLAEAESQPTQEQFCEALNREFDGKPLVIVDMSDDNMNYLSDWQNAILEERAASHFPNAGVVTNVQPVPLPPGVANPIPMPPNAYGKPTKPLTFSLRSFQLRGQAGQTNTFHHLCIENWTDGGALGPERAQKLVEAVKAVQGQIATERGNSAIPVPIHSHCAFGDDRSPSLVIYHSIDATAAAWEALGGTCCCDISQQGEVFVGGMLNLACEVHDFLPNGLDKRGVFGFGKGQHQSYVAYAEYRAKLSQARAAAA